MRWIKRNEGYEDVRRSVYRTPGMTFKPARKKAGQFLVKNWPSLCKTSARVDYASSFKSACGAELACASAATEDCSSTCDLVKLAASAATSASRMRDSAAESLVIWD